MTVDSDTFRALLGRFPSGVTVVTAYDDAGQPHGMTVSSFCSVSLEPPLVLVCIEHSASMHDLLAGADAFAVNVLADDQEELSRRFADTGVAARFDGVPWLDGPGGPLIGGAHASLECVAFAQHNAGDHTVIVGEVRGGRSTHDGGPLVYYRGGYGQLG